MKKISSVSSVLFFLALGGSYSWALPSCPSGENAYWDNCFGTWRHESGYKYVGEWKNDKQHGQGTATWADGDIYVGEYKDGNKHGQGTYAYISGHKYVGEYKDNKRNGQGTYTYADGRKEVGEFKNDLLNGYAIQYNADGSIEREGIFKDDEFLYEEKRSENTSSSSENSELDNHKEFCKEIGFTPGTEKFGDCVMKLMDKD